MGFDIRLPIGLLFLTIGVLLGAYGALTGGSTAVGSRGLPVNLAWGCVLIVFGLLMLRLSWRRTRGDHDRRA